MSINKLSSLFNVLLAKSFLVHLDIASNSPMVKERILKDQSNMSPKLCLAVVFYILSINQNLSSFKLIKAQKEVDDGGFTRSSRSNKSDRFTLLDLERNMFQNISFSVIRKTNVFEFYIAFLDFQVFIFLDWFIVSPINDFKNTLSRNHRGLKN